MMNFPPEATITHFSHVHPLHLSNHRDHLTLATCSGCMLQATGMIYTCSPCNYFLHIKCAKMPQQIIHPFRVHQARYHHQPFNPQYTATRIPIQNVLPPAVLVPFAPRPNITNDSLALHRQFFQGLSNNSSHNFFVHHFLQTLLAGAGVSGGVGSGFGGIGSGIGLQQIYQLLLGFNAAGGGGGGGAVPGFDLLGSVGNGQNIFQTLSGNNGGVSLGVLQTLMGGGDGGSSMLNSGLDALTGLLGGFSF